jgi:predicted nucleic acid-binding protein
VLRVTCDTNIFISGLNYQGKPFEILSLARSGAIDLAISDRIMEEVKRVLDLKFHWPSMLSLKRLLRLKRSQECAHEVQPHHARLRQTKE